MHLESDLYETSAIAPGHTTNQKIGTDKLTIIARNVNVLLT